MRTTLAPHPRPAEQPQVVNPRVRGRLGGPGRPCRTGSADLRDHLERVLTAAKTWASRRATNSLTEATPSWPRLQGRRLQGPSRERAKDVFGARNVFVAAAVTLSLFGLTAPLAPLAPLPGATPSTGGRGRRLTDEEILLLRLHALRLAKRGRHTVACQYALTEAGARPTETTSITRAAILNWTQVQLPGVGNRAVPRLLSLPHSSIPIFRRAFPETGISGQDYQPALFTTKDRARRP